MLGVEYCRDRIVFGESVCGWFSRVQTYLIARLTRTTTKRENGNVSIL